jgi:hypothetical protein
VVNSFDLLPAKWIPFDAFSNVKFLARGGFATVFIAEWKNGYSQVEKIVLKNIGKRITSENVNEVCRCVLSLCDG